MASAASHHKPVHLASQVIGTKTFAVSSIWIGATAMAVFAPDLITGSEQEHIPFAAFTVWFYAALATAFVLTAVAARKSDTEGLSSQTAISVMVIWAAVTVAAIFSPEMVTGTDPTQLPIGAVVAPILGMISTAFVSIIEAGR